MEHRWMVVGRDRVRIAASCLARVAICLCLGGCGEIAFKRGGGGEEFSAVLRDCRQQSPDEPAYSDCLTRGGWSVTRLETPVKTAEPPVAGAVSAPSGPTVRVADDPLAIVSVASWWKAGGGPAGLQTSVNDCVAVLGPSHQPDAGYRRVTRALYRCLNEQGWHALGQAQ